MDYRLELKDSSTFEKLIISICQKLLGLGVISFSSGKDGGRDGKFIGTAQNYPSETAPWSGKFIIQVKHTENPIASCSDRSFRKEIIEKEIPKIKSLKENGEVDNYLLFTNRKYSGVKGEELLREIIAETGVENSVIIQKDQINDFIKKDKTIIKEFGLDKHITPFDFSYEEIKDIILAFKNQLPSIEEDLKKKVDQLKYEFSYLEKEEKNERNRLGKEYYQNVILSRSLMDFSKIRHFFEDPRNDEYKNYYFDIATELDQIITLKREQFDAFEEVFVHAYQIVCDSDSILKGGKRHVLTLLHFMYFECVIGKK